MLRITVIEGRLTHDPELKTTASGISVCSFSIASQRNYKVGDDYPTDYFDVVAWRNSAEYVSKHLKKGDRVFILGSFETRRYEDKNGNKRIAFELKADQIRRGDYNSNSEGRNNVPLEETPHFGNSGGDFEPDFDDLPFG